MLRADAERLCYSTAHELDIILAEDFSKSSKPLLSSFVCIPRGIVEKRWPNITCLLTSTRTASIRVISRAPSSENAKL